MSKTIATYYAEEMENWKYSLDFYSGEIDQLNEKLEDVIRRNSIKNIAEKVELHLDALKKVSEIFAKVEEAIQQQGKLLKPNNDLVDNSSINGDTEKLQAVLRINVQAAEKAFIDAKFDCYNFLSKTIHSWQN